MQTARVLRKAQRRSICASSAVVGGPFLAVDDWNGQARPTLLCPCPRQDLGSSTFAPKTSRSPREACIGTLACGSTSISMSLDGEYSSSEIYSWLWVRTRKTCSSLQRQRRSPSFQSHGDWRLTSGGASSTSIWPS